MPNLHMIANLQFFHSDNNIQMPDLNVISDSAFLRIEDAYADAHTLADLVTKKQAINGTLQERGKETDNRKCDQSEFAHLMHVLQVTTLKQLADLVCAAWLTHQLMRFQFCRGFDYLIGCRLLSYPT